MNGATDRAPLEAFRLADSFLPEGSDTVSYGLEQFIERDGIEDAEGLRGLLQTYVQEQLASADLIALRHAHAGARGGDLDAIEEADRHLESVTLAREFRESSTRSGERLLTLHRELLESDTVCQYAKRVDADDAPGHYSVVLGVITAETGVEEPAACHVACHGFLTGLLAAAQRLAPIGHTAIQRTLRELQPAMDAAVTASAEGSIDRMGPCAPLIDVAAAEHERAQRRLFQS